MRRKNGIVPRFQEINQITVKLPLGIGLDDLPRISVHPGGQLGDRKPFIIMAHIFRPDPGILQESGPVLLIGVIAPTDSGIKVRDVFRPAYFRLVRNQIVVKDLARTKIEATAVKQDLQFFAMDRGPALKLRDAL